MTPLPLAPARRAVLVGAAAALGVGALSPEGARAQAPAPPLANAGASLPNAGTYGFRVGEVRATVVSDGTLSGPPRVYAGDAPEAELRAALEGAFRPADAVRLNLNALLLQWPGRTVLIEAGAGGTFGPDGGRLVGHLAALGVRPGDVGDVVISHAHPDHVGNLRGADGAPAFPNAAVHVPAPDWAFFVTGEPDLSRLPMSAEFRARFIANIKRSLAPVADRAVLYSPGAEVVPGVLSLPAPGHTPGMVGLLVASGPDQLLLTADAAYDPMLNVERGWRPGPDLDPELAVLSRRRLFDRAAADRALVLGFHFPFPGLGRIGARGTGYAWAPAPWDLAGTAPRP